MSINPGADSNYIRQFAGLVRHGTSPLAWSEWTQRIRDLLEEIEDPRIRAQAHESFIRISNYGSILAEDPEGSRESVANEIERFADFVSRLTG